MFLKVDPFITGLQFFESSAKDNVNVKQVFDKLVDMICKKMDEAIDRDSLKSGKGKAVMITLSCVIQYSQNFAVFFCHKG